MESHPIVRLIWNFFPFTLIIWNPLREVLNFPFWIPRFFLSPIELAWNFFPESTIIIIINGTGLYYLKTINDKNRCEPNEENDNCKKFETGDKRVLYGIAWGMIAADIVLFTTFVQYFWLVIGGIIILVIGLLTEWTFLQFGDESSQIDGIF